ncbi:MAG: RNA polymerase sigma-70 factor (ECF subfamily) [Rhodothermales bacterium]|jgi:RNA polymerase sigma-70 factor (ECF subfamily)
MIETQVNSADEVVRQLIRKAIASFQTPLLRYAARFLNEPDIAQDVVQDAFIRLHQALHGQKDVRDVRAWLFRVTHNLAIDHCRKTRSFSPLEHAQSELLSQGPELDCGDRGMMLALANAELAKLPTNYREVIALKVVEGLTFREISGITGDKIPTLHFRLKKGLAELARRLALKGVER